MIATAIVPWLHLAAIVAALLFLFAGATWSQDRESAYALTVIGVLLLIFVAIEHGALAGLRGRWPCPHPAMDHVR